MAPGTLPTPNSMTTGIRYTKLGIVCMTSRAGVTVLRMRLWRAISTPTGMPKRIQMRVQTRMNDSVRMASSHMPKKPMTASTTRTAAVCSRCRVIT